MRRRWIGSITGAIAAAALTGLVIAGAGTGAAKATPPTNVSAPTISGSASVGSTLTASTGSWSGDTPITFSFQWRQCDSSGSACSDIGGATSQTYSVVSGDVGHTLRVNVTADNAAGTGSQLSNATGVVATGPPSNTSPPTVTGSLAIGGTLTVQVGTWSGTAPITYSYQWERCDSGGGNCQYIGGATGASYVVSSADAGHRLVVLVTAQNSGGSQVASATAGNVAGGGAPSNTSAPKVTGSLAIGGTLTVQVGSWSGTAPISFSYQWERCDSNGGNCQYIGGATGSSYKVASADAGHRLVVLVTAKNSGGSKVVSATAGNVGSGVPTNTSAPKVTGSLAVGGTLTLQVGSWTGTAPISFSYQWQRCDANGGNCQNIGGATGSTYRVSSSDPGHRLIVIVTAKNSAGTKQAVATAGNVGGGSGPANTAAPRITGSFGVGGTLTVQVGSWSGTQPISFSYQWQRCDANGGNCQYINGATASSYRVAAADIGHRLVALVTARNSVGSKVASATVGNVGGTSAGGARAASTLALPDRLVIDRVKFSPNPVRSRNVVITARFHVSDTSGHPISGALVYMLGIPYNRIDSVPESPTDGQGWATFRFQPTKKFPIVRGGALVVFVRARTPQGSVLAGTSTRRLVQLRVAKPS